MPRKSQHERKILGIEEDGNAKFGSPVFEKVSSVMGFLFAGSSALVRYFLRSDPVFQRLIDEFFVGEPI